MGITSKNWKEYFETYHEGIGTIYERFSLHKYFEFFLPHIETVLEYPVFGMTGITGMNSIYFALCDKKVTLVDSNAERIERIKNLWKKINAPLEIQYSDFTFPLELRSKFDLVWNFCALPYLTDTQVNVVLEGMAGHSSRYLFICTFNKNLFFQFKKLLEKDWKKEVNFRLVKNISYFEKLISVFLLKKGFKLSQKVYFDVPWWPDFAVSKEKIIPFLFKREPDKAIPDYIRYLKNETKLEMAKYRKMGFENSFYIFKKLWAHHVGWIFSKC